MSQAEKATDSGSVFGFIGSTMSGVVDSQLNDAEAATWFVNNHPYVGSAVSLIASAIHADGYNILNPSPDADQEAVNKDPRTIALRTLFDSINEEQTLMDLIEEISMDMDGPGRAYAHKLRLPNGNCVGLERIDPRTMAAVLSADRKSILKFVQKIKVNGILRSTDFKAEDIIYFKRPGGADLLGGQSLIQQLDLTLAVDFGSRKSNAARYANGPRAGMVLMFESLSKDDSEKLEKNVVNRAGAENAHKPMVLTGKGTVNFPKSDTDEEFTKALDRSRQEVCAVYHVPESKLMTTEGALGGNGKEQDDQTFHEECVMPRCRRIFATLTRELLLKEYGITDLIVAPKSKYAIRVSAIEDATKMLQAGGTLNEARDLIGLPKSASKADLDAPCYPTTITTAKDPADVQMSLPLDPDQAPIQTDDKNASKGVAQNGTKGKASSVSEDARAFATRHEDRVDAKAPGLAKKIVKAKHEWQDHFWRLAGLAKKAASDDLTLTALEVAHIKAVLKELRAHGASEAYVHAIYGDMVAAYEHGWGEAKTALDIKLDLAGPVQVHAMAAIRQRSEDFADLADSRDSQTVLTLLDQALAEGWTPGRLGDEIGQAFSDGVHIYGDAGALQKVVPTDSWADLVARTELARAQTQGALALYADAGIKTVQYVTNGTPCDECADHDGEVYSVDDLGDNEPPLHPNCCCSLTPYDEDVRYQEPEAA